MIFPSDFGQVYRTQKTVKTKEKKMKKLLAFLLVIVMILSVSLVACAKKNNTPDDTDDDDWGNGGGTTTAAPNGDENNGDSNVPTTSWVDKADVVYTGVNNLNLRLEPSANASVVKTVATAGTALNRVATNGTWDKIELGEGDAKQTAYVLSAYISQISTNFSFTTLPAENQSTLTIIGDSKVNLRSTPFVPEGDYNYSNVAIQEFKAENGTLTKVAVSASGNWYQVSYVGTIGTKTYTGSEVLYIASSSIASGYVSDSAATDNGGTLG